LPVKNESLEHKASEKKLVFVFLIANIEKLLKISQTTIVSNEMLIKYSF